MNRNGCPRPLDPVDAQALAAGVGGLFVPDAGEHADGCPSCRSLVAEAAALTKKLDDDGEATTATDLADRVIRLRSFSRRERSTLALWAMPVGVGVSLFCGGCLLLVIPGISTREQVGLALAASGPLLSLTRAFADWLLGAARFLPAGLEGLSDAFRYQTLPGLVAVLLLFPFGLGLRRVLARARR